MFAGRLILLLLLLVLPLRAQDSAPAENAPAKSTNVEAPIPDITTLMHDVEQHQRDSEKLRSHYFYRASTRTEELDGKGNIKKVDTRVNEIFTRQGVTVSRLIEKDGKRLSDKDQKKEDEQIDKDVKEAVEKREKRERDGKPTNGNGEDVLTVSRILELGSFSNPRRQIFKGRSTIVVDYTGDPHANTRNRFENVFKLLAGTLWVDEQTRTLVRGEGHVTDNFHIGGGLVANIHKGFHFSFEQAHINNEIWLPAVIEGEGSARLFLFVKIQGRSRTTFSDYRKFNASATILPGVTPVNDPPAEEPPTQK